MTGSLWVAQARVKRITTLGLVSVLSTLSWAAADTGEGLYGKHCASCHAASLRGSAHGAALSGPAFADKWSALSAQSLLTYQMVEMPPGEAQSLSPAQHAAIAQLHASVAAASSGNSEAARLSSTRIDGQTAPDFSPKHSVNRYTDANKARPSRLTSDAHV